jgi:ABC-type uncharacterized transport system permease subunit
MTQKRGKMNIKTEGLLAILAALLVLFSAMWDARISAVISIAALAALGLFKLLQKNS